MEYTLPMNLQRIAMLKITTSFWEKKDVKDRVEEFLKTYKDEIYGIRNEWRELTKTLVDKWKKDVLPPNLEIELIYLVKVIGETIFSWYQYIKHEYEIEEELINLIDKIYWTPYGTIDEVKTFKSYWLNNPNVDITNMYKFACDYVLEEHIDDLWNKIPDNIQDHPFNDIYDNFDQHIITYWKCCRDGDLPNFMRYIEIAAEDFNRQDMDEFNLIYNLNRSIEENMLRLSAHQGHFSSVRYFWGKLTEEERDESVLKCARIAVLCYHNYNQKIRATENYKKNQYAQIYIFLMNQMSAAHKKAFFNEKLELDTSSYWNWRDVKDDILSILLSTWPWQELFIPVLKDMLQYQDDDTQMDCMFLEEITLKMLLDYELGYCLETNKYRYLLREAWLTIPTSIKQKLNMNEARGDSNFIRDLISIWDIDSLKLILNDPDIKAKKDKYIDIEFYSFGQLIIADNYEKLDQFIEEIFESEEEKKWFKQMIEAPFYFVIEDRLDLLDKLLDWQCSTLEERQFMKNKIDHLDWCEELINDHDYELVEKFLDWKFETQEEKRNCKDHFKSDLVSLQVICEIWLRNTENIDKAKDESSQFLNWFLDSEEEIILFKREIVSRFRDRIDPGITNWVVRLTQNRVLNNFIIWCLLDDEQSQQI